LTGAKVLVTGRVFKAKSRHHCCQNHQHRTSRVYGETVQGRRRFPWSTCIQSGGQDCRGDYHEGRHFGGQGGNREERVARISRPSPEETAVVAVKVSERHYGPHIIDPAAETDCL